MCLPETTRFAMTVSDTSLITHEFSFRADWKGGATVATIVHATCNMQHATTTRGSSESVAS